MANDLVVIENALKPLAPRFDAVLGGMMESRHLIQSVLFSIERNKKLADASLASLLSAAMTFANLRLPVDGATGQGFIIPFKGIAQPVIGYKGFNTIAARAAITITGGVAREGDHEWDYREGTGGFVRHKKKLDNTGRIIAAWAVSEALDRPPAVAIVGIGEINEIMSRSPAVKYGADTPWKDPKVGFPAMSEKTAKRRLSRTLPFEIDAGRFHKAARVDEAHDEQGKHSYIDQRGEVIVTDDESPIADREPGPQPTAQQLIGAKADPELERIKGFGRDAAEGGTPMLELWWRRLGPPMQAKLKSYLESTLKPTAAAADKEGEL